MILIIFALFIVIAGALIAFLIFNRKIQMSHANLQLEIEERKRVGEALQESEELYRTVVENSHDGILILGEDYKLTYVNMTLCKMFGYKRKEMIGHDFREFLEEADKKLVTDRYIRRLKGEEVPPRYEFNVVRGDGEKRRVEVSSAIVKDSKSNLRIIGQILDITERKKAEEALIKEKNFSDKLIQSSPIFFVAINPDGKVIMMNDTMLDALGYSADEVKGRDYLSFLVPAKEQVLLSGVFKKLITSHKKTLNENHILTKTGEELPVEWHGRSIFRENGSLEYFFGVGIDITERNRAAEALRESEQRLSIKNQLAHIFLTVPDEEMYGEVLHVVLGATESRYGIFGYIDKKGDWICPSLTRNVWNQCKIPDKNIVFPKKQWGGGIWGQAMLEKKPLYSNEPFSVPDGHIPIFRALDVPVIYQGEVIGNFLVGNRDADYGETEIRFLVSLCEYIAPVLHARLQRDIKEEEKKKLETQLYHSQKMEAIGTLAGGIAHDFNNILAAIIGASELAMMEAPEGSSLHRHVNQVLTSGLRGAKLVKQILAFSRQREQAHILMSIKPIVKESLKLLKSSIPSTIKVQTSIETDNEIIKGDPTQIEQVLVNLCTNASHAMREKGGIIEVGIRNVELGIENKVLKSNPDLHPGQYVCLSVKDTGYGISPETMEHIFDPYFTTKAMGEGTGLGLAVVQGIVRKHAGAITAKSEPGRETIFEVYFPSAEETGKEVQGKNKTPLPTGNERILFIDDEEALADIAREMLEGLGYEVTTMTSSLKALEHFKIKPEGFDLVITDMSMPTMTGAQLSAELMKIRPDIPIILCTGFSHIISEEKAWEIGIKAFVMKPLEMNLLAETVRKVLDRGERPLYLLN